MTHTDMYDKIDHMMGVDLQLTWEALGKVPWGPGSLYNNEDGGVTMDEWAEAIYSRLTIVSTTRVTVYQCVGWYKNIKEPKSTNMSDGAMFIDRGRAIKYASERMRPETRIEKVEGVLLYDVLDPENYRPQDAKARLEYLRGEIESERISMGEIAELESLVEHIEPGDVLLLEWAGVSENPASTE